jgi:Flp pilus assembly protein TadG
MIIIVIKSIFPNRSHLRGQAVVEFALVVPLLILMMLGIIEMGWVVRNSVTISNAAREGSRAAALGKKTTDISTRITNYASDLTTSVTMQYSTDNGANWQNWPADGATYNGVTSGNLIQITVTTTHQQLTHFIPYLSGVTLKQQSIMRREST